MEENHTLPLLQRQYAMARYLLLATVIATVVNMFLGLAMREEYIPYCAVLPYYLTLIGFYFDGLRLDTYTVTGMVMTFLLLSVWLLAWFKSKEKSGWLKVGFGLALADGVILLLYALLFSASLMDHLVEIVLHIAIIYEIHVGIRADKQLRQILSGGFTPAQTEYRDGFQ